MIDELQVWENGRHVGVFHQDETGTVGFSYDDDAAAPISLSLMPHSQWADDAPGAFLENLLPDEPSARDVMAMSLGAASTSTFDLLDGVDAAGGLIFTRSTGNPFTVNPVYTPMPDNEIVGRIRELRRYGSAWWANDPNCRFSLGGHQGKFSASRAGGAWFYPNIAMPSTHIFKPDPHDLPHSGDVEMATMNLAQLCGLEVPDRSMATFPDPAGDERCYIIERFDRIPRGGRMIRLRCEDMLQSMGLRPEAKYDPNAADCIRLLNTADPTGNLAYQWITHLAFAVYAGNSDAHAKNTSIMLGTQIALAPVYDEVCTRFWPRFNQEMAIDIGGEVFVENVTFGHWKRLAECNRLEAERVVNIAERMRQAVRNHMDEAVEELDPMIAGRLRETWAKTTRGGTPGYL